MPQDCPSCDADNGSDTNTQWTREELHHITRYQRLLNYKHLVQTSKDGQCMEAGEFPTSLGAYATIPMAKRGRVIDHDKIKYLDVVHMDIAFGD